MTAHTYIFTSNDSLMRCFPGVDLNPLLRRITCIMEFLPNGKRTTIKGNVICDHGGHGHEVERVILSPVQPPAAAEPIPVTPTSPELIDPDYVIGSNPEGWPVMWIE